MQLMQSGKYPEHRLENFWSKMITSAPRIYLTSNLVTVPPTVKETFGHEVRFTVPIII
jgi:hypothetical protein